MDSFPRLWPYIRPHRQRLVVSIVLGFMIAILWGANLTAAFPIVKILLEGKNLHEYVEQTVAEASEKEQQLLTELKELDTKLRGVEPAAMSAEKDPETLELLRSQARKQRELASKQSTIYQFGWLQYHVMPYVPQNEFQILAWLLVIVLAATAVKGVLIFFQDVLVGSVAESTVRGVRQQMLDRALGLDYQTLSLEGHSGLMSRFTYDAEQLSQGISLLGGKMIREPLKCIACMILALVVNWRLTLLSLVFIPLLGLFLSRFGKMLKRASRRMMESMSQIYKVLEETFDGLKVVIGYHNAEHHQHLFEKQYDGYYKKAMRVVRIDAAAKPLLELLGLAAMFVALIPGAYLVLRGKTDIWGVQLSEGVMDAAALGFLYACLVGMLDPCRKMSSGFSRLKRSTAAIDRIFQLMDQQSLVTNPPDAKPFGRHEQTVEFRDVSFRYATRDRHAQRGLALEHVDLTAEFGEVVAIVGTNGCGKSTLVNLLPRYYDPDTGEVAIDGRPLQSLSLEDLRRQVGIVTQDTILFEGTILDNIRYGCPDATREQVEEAARRAHVMPIVQSMPQGFDTFIGDKGKDLSGGQRQRIALARVILRDPGILILDEATSAADAESESLIHETLKTFVRNRTTFIISHTLSKSLLDLVTKIVVMENGKIVACGAHDELLATSPLYQRLYSSPSRQIGEVVPKAA